MTKRFMVMKSGKCIGFEDSESEAFELIKRDLNVKKNLEYKVLDLSDNTVIQIDGYITDLKREARWAKKKTSKKKIRRNDVINNKYSKWLGTQPCVITGQTAVRGVGYDNMHCHHIHGRNGIRNDFMQVPLLGYIHSWGGKSYHSCSQSDFIQHHNLPTSDLIGFFEYHAKRLRKVFLQKHEKNNNERC